MTAEQIKVLEELGFKRLHGRTYDCNTKRQSTITQYYKRYENGAFASWTKKLGVTASFKAADEQAVVSDLAKLKEVGL